MADQLPYPGPAPMALRCPKCAADMVTYERSGVIIDQCRECRGMFLDRGELERLIDAEGRTVAGPSHPAASRGPAGGPSYQRGPRHDAGPPYAAPHDAPYRGDGPYRDERYGDDRYDTRGYRRDRDDDDDDDDRPWDSGRGPGRPSKRRGLLGELLEGLGD